jgi:hypothetical protein
MVYAERADQLLGVLSSRVCVSRLVGSQDPPVTRQESLALKWTSTANGRAAGGIYRCVDWQQLVGESEGILLVLERTGDLNGGN